MGFSEVTYENVNWIEMAINREVRDHLIDLWTTQRRFCTWSELVYVSRGEHITIHEDIK
jgi:hypothetical protein